MPNNIFQAIREAIRLRNARKGMRENWKESRLQYKLEKIMKNPNKPLIDSNRPGENLKDAVSECA